MSAARPFHHKNLLPLSGILLIFLCWSCAVVPKNYPVNKPFVFKYNVDVEGNLPSIEKAELKSKLINQMDDSIRVRTVKRLFYKGINRSVLDRPPVYDSSNAEKTVGYMRALLNSRGFFKDTISYAATIDTVNDQYRTTVNFTVNPGKVVRIDSFSYNISQTDLQQIAILNQKDALIKKGDPFAKAPISVELDRLVDLYRNNGYLLFGRESLIGLWDTLDVSLLRPSFDPNEQLEILQKLRARQDTPTANLEIRLKPGFDSSRLRKYYFGNIDVYPDYGPDTASYSRKEVVVDGIRIIYFRNIFKPRILPKNIFFRRGDMYDQRLYYKTISRFNSLGAWRLTNIEYFPRKFQDTADFRIQLTPARKYSFTANLEGSVNQSAISGNLLGIGLNLGLQNRNFARAANHAASNLRFGIETGRDTVTGVKFTQSRQVSFSHVIYFPKPILGNALPEKLKDNIRTILSFNASATQRRELYDLNIVNAAFGYEGTGKWILANIRWINFEYSSFKSKPKLDAIIINNPSLRNIFTDGLVSSLFMSGTFNTGTNKKASILKTNLELSGLGVLGLIHNKFLDDNLYKFIKVDADYAHKLIFGKSALALRAFAGVGWELNSTKNPLKRNNLPFFKQYFAGGPNSMRAWGLRKLGPGSVIRNFGTTGVPDRYGDVQIEFNAEWRFPVYYQTGVTLNLALFTDIGNIWYLKKAAGLPEEVFNINRLAKDLAVGIGTGLRIDFSFFVIRLDYSYKAKDPSPSSANGYLQNKWFGYKFRDGDQFQLGINYPFIQ